MVLLCLIIWRIMRLFSKVIMPLYIPTSRVCRTNFLHSCQHYYIWLFTFQPSWFMWSISLWFWFAFSWCWASFYVHIGHLWFLLEKYLFWHFAHFLMKTVVLLMNCKSCLYSSDKSPFWDKWFIKIFALCGMLIYFLDSILWIKKVFKFDEF